MIRSVEGRPPCRPCRISVAIYAAVLAGLCAGCNALPASRDAGSIASNSNTSTAPIHTTAGTVAVGNLNAQIDGERHLLAQQPPAADRYATLADLVTMRGQFLSRIADYEEALAFAELAVQRFPDAGASYLARAKAQATFHRFANALADLDAAAAHGANHNRTDPVRAAILQAQGRYDDALKIRRHFADARPTIRNLQPLAALEGERGELQSAAMLFASAVASYRDVSPFPVAWCEFQEGLMWMREGQLTRARDAFARAHERLPQYAAAQGHLGEIEAALGNRAEAIRLLHDPAQQSDDPDYAAQLARILRNDGQIEAAQRWRDRAATRYEVLIAKFPEAFADHATEFWLAAGNDPARALELARRNVANRPTARAYQLLLASALATEDHDATCDAVSHARALPYVPHDLMQLTVQAAKLCPVSS